MIHYRPIAPLTLGPRKGWRSVAAAVVMAALLGTTATSAVAAEPEASVTQSGRQPRPPVPAIPPNGSS